MMSTQLEDYFPDVESFGPEFFSVAESLNEGLVLADEEGHVRFTNSRFLELTGFSSKEILGKKIFEIFFPEPGADRDEERQRMLSRYQARREGISEVYETHIFRKDGNRRWIETKAGPLIDRAGRIVGSIGANSDITEKKQLEEQLRWSQKMEAVGRLAGGIAHDFNNLLTVIQGYADLLRQQMGSSDPQVRKVDVIREASEAASTLTQQLLSISRKQVAQMRPTSVNDVIEKSLRVVQGLIGDRVHLVVDLTERLPLILGDAGQIQQVLLNLVVNAKDAMPDGGKLLIETTLVDASGNVTTLDMGAEFLRLRVEDDGIGMNEEIKKHLFEPFFTTKKSGRGTGLGLSISYSIAEEHDARILVSSEPGEGSSFDVLFQLSANASAEKNGGEPWRSLAGTETILVVEDHIAVRVLLTETLRRNGYEVLEADDGKEALQLIEGRSCPKVDLLLSDLVMPRVGGFELANDFSRRMPHAGVVLISGYAGDVEEIEAAERLGYEFLPKPFNPNTLLQVVRKVLDRRAQIKAQP